MATLAYLLGTFALSSVGLVSREIMFEIGFVIYLFMMIKVLLSIIVWTDISVLLGS